MFFSNLEKKMFPEMIELAPMVVFVELRCIPAVKRETIDAKKIYRATSNQRSLEVSETEEDC